MLVHGLLLNEHDIVVLIVGMLPIRKINLATNSHGFRTSIESWYKIHRDSENQPGCLGIAPMLVDFLLLNKDDIVVLIVGVAIHLASGEQLCTLRTCAWQLVIGSRNPRRQ